MMASFLPSEIARLVLGYLKEEGCQKSYQTFLKESAYLTEYRTMLERGKEFPTSIVGQKLTDMLEEYGLLKIQDDNPATDVLGKFDKAVNQLRNLAKFRHMHESPKPETVATFQKRRGFYNARKNSRAKLAYTSPMEDETTFNCNASVVSDPASSPRSQVGGESPNTSGDTHPNSSTETQQSISILQQSSHSSGGSVHASGITDGSSLTTSTPGRNLSDGPSVSQRFPYQSPIVISDSDHPFSPDSYPGTPGVHTNCSQVSVTLIDVHESPKSRPSLPIHSSSPLLSRVRKDHVPISPKIHCTGSPKNLCSSVINDTNNTLSDRDRHIEAMRTGDISKLSKENLEKVGRLGPKVTLKNFGVLKKVVSSSKFNVKESDAKSVERSDQKTSTSKRHQNTEPVNDDVMVDDEIIDNDPNDTLMIASPCKTPEKINVSNGNSPKGEPKSRVPACCTDLKTPVKNFLDEECSRGSFRSPKRKSQAPKRRSVDPDMKGSLVTPVKNVTQHLSMPKTFDEMLISTGIPELLADTINQSMKTKPESALGGGGRRSRTSSVGSSVGSCTTTPVKSTARRKSVSPKPWRKSVSPARSPQHEEMVVAAGDKNDSSNSLKPPLSNEEYDELNSVLEDSRMSESTIQGIIAMTQSYPEIDALFDLFDVDKPQFMEQQFRSALKTTPAKNSLPGASTSQQTCSSQESNQANNQEKLNLLSSTVKSESSINTGNMPTIHVQTVTNNSTEIQAASTSNNSFLQLLHTSNNPNNSYVETVQIVSGVKVEGEEKENRHDTSMGFVPSSSSSSSVTSSSDIVECNQSAGISAVGNIELSVQDTTDSTGSDDAVLELPNGMKVGVLPAGTDLNSQMQTLHTLTQLQKLLANGYTLTPAGPAVTTATTGAPAIVTPVKVVNSTSGSGANNTVSPNTASMIDTINSQQIQITHSSLDTVDMSGLGLVTGPPEKKIKTPKSKKTKNVNRKKRGRPKKNENSEETAIDVDVTNEVKTEAGSDATAENDATVPANKMTSPIKQADESSVKTVISPNRRLGMRDFRTDKRRKLGIPSTLTVPKSLSEQTQNQPIITYIDGQKVMLIPEANKTNAIQNSDVRLNSEIETRISEHSQSKGGILQNLLQTSMASSILGTSTINSLSDKCTVNSTVQSSSGAIVCSKVQNVISTSKALSPSPTRRKLFGISDTNSPLAPLHNENVRRKVESISSNASPVITTASIKSMGSMLLSPIGKVNIKGCSVNMMKQNIFTSPKNKGNIIHTNTGAMSGVYKINAGLSTDLEKSFNTSITVVSRNSTMISSGEYSKVNLTNPENTQNENNASSISLLSMPSSFDAATCHLDTDTSENKLNTIVTENSILQTNGSKSRRVALLTLKPGEGEDSNSFQSAYPNIVSNVSLKAQPGLEEEILSPTSFKSKPGFLGACDDTTRMSLESALKIIDEPKEIESSQIFESSEDVETAQILINFSTKPVVTPKKYNLPIDDTSNDVEKSNQGSSKKNFNHDCRKSPRLLKSTAKFTVAESFEVSIGKSSKKITPKKSKMITPKKSNYQSPRKSVKKTSKAKKDIPNQLLQIITLEDSDEDILDTSLKIEDSAPKTKSSFLKSKTKKKTEYVVKLNSGVSKQENVIHESYPSTSKNYPLSGKALQPVNSKNSKKLLKNFCAVKDRSSTLNGSTSIRSKSDGVRKLVLKKDESNISLDDCASVKPIYKVKMVKVKKSNIAAKPHKLSEVIKSDHIMETGHFANKTNVSFTGEHENSMDKDNGEGDYLSKVCDQAEEGDIVGSNYDKHNSYRNIDAPKSDTSLESIFPETPEKQCIPHKLIPGTSPYRSLSLAKLAELGTKELKAHSPSKNSSFTLFSPLRPPRTNNSLLQDSPSPVINNNDENEVSKYSSKVVQNLYNGEGKKISKPKKRKLSLGEQSEKKDQSQAKKQKISVSSETSDYRKELQKKGKLDKLLKKLENKKDKQKKQMDQKSSMSPENTLNG